MDEVDFRLLIAVLAVLLAAATKGISGIGLPVVATPILAVLYDLPTAIAVAILPTALSDMPILYTYRSEWRQALRFIPMIAGGMAGVFIGTQILIRVNQELLKAALGLGVLLFVVISWFHLLPRLSDRFA
ncbi:MAG: sulfite exporter TauE/SafE family protein, partial [Acidobacteriota bacterium]